jgi:solute:Na+ symporter, SSS family
MDTPRIELTSYEVAIFVAYLLLTVVVGFLVARKGRRNPRDYFMGDKRLPWYVVGTSMVATAISSDHFIAQVGAGYTHGIVIAAFGWNAWIVYTLLIWIFCLITCAPASTPCPNFWSAATILPAATSSRRF